MLPKYQTYHILAPFWWGSNRHYGGVAWYICRYCHLADAPCGGQICSSSQLKLLGTDLIPAGLQCNFRTMLSFLLVLLSRKWSPSLTLGLWLLITLFQLSDQEQVTQQKVQTKMSNNTVVNVENWITQNQNAFLPPVCNKLMWVILLLLLLSLLQVNMYSFSLEQQQQQQPVTWQEHCNSVTERFQTTWTSAVSILFMLLSGTFPSWISCLLGVLTSGRIIILRKGRR